MVLRVEPPATRVLGVREGDLPGPLFFVLGGVHGNEPGGVVAARRVLAALDRSATPIHGRLVFLAGNLTGLARGTRYVDRDLNRMWSQETIHRVLHQDPTADTTEEREMRELLGVVKAHLRVAPWEAVVVLDLHSTSADGAPFSIMADTLQNRRIAYALPVPVLLGLEESLEGTILSYVGGLGHVAVCIEGGQNEREATIANHEAALWLTLVAAGALAAEDAPVDLAEERRRLASNATDLPRVVEIAHRHGIETEDDFHMLPGFANFQDVRHGEVLARSGPTGTTPVHAPVDGLLLMPRYQGQGDDGFFVGREVRPFWLALSAILRRMHLYRLLPWLPGVRKDPEDSQVLRADLRIARWLPVQIFHLFGYRRARLEERALVFVRRPDRFR